MEPSQSSRGTTASDIAPTVKWRESGRGASHRTQAAAMEGVTREERARKLRLRFTPSEMLREDGSLNPEYADA